MYEFEFVRYFSEINETLFKTLYSLKEVERHKENLKTS